MGFFGKSKKKASSPGSPLVPSTTGLLNSVPSTPPSPALSTLPVRPSVNLRVHVYSNSVNVSDSNESFWISVHPEDSVDAIRRDISERLGGVGVGIFKVAIPAEAFDQAKEYTRRYKTHIDLISHFPAYSLDDPEQLRHSLGPAGWQMQLPQALRVKDWWPFPLLSDDLVSIVARPIAHTGPAARPLTLISHFAPADPGHGASNAYHASGSGSSTPTSKLLRRPPTPVDILPSSSIAQLKAAILHADGRSVAVEKLDKVVLWRVEMSEQEMVVIEERGGLKGGQMPWPYPPTAEVPVALANDALPVSHYFPDTHSNTRIVSLSVWVHPSAALSLARVPAIDAIDAPAFKYPMLFPTEVRRASASHSLPSTSPALDVEVVVAANTLPARVAGKTRRARPSTAPAACDSPNSSPTCSPAPVPFGGLRSARGRSPLAPAPTHPFAAIKGLGIGGSDFPPSSLAPSGIPNSLDLTKLSLQVEVGESVSNVGISSGAPSDFGDKIIWQPAVGSLRRAGTQSKGIRSLANERSLRAYEIV